MGKNNIESNILLFYGKNHPPIFIVSKD